MGRFPLLALVTAVGACSKGDSLVVVSVSADPPLADVDVLHTSSSAGGRSSVHDFSDGATFTLPPAMTFGVEVPSSIAGPFTVHVDALDANGVVLAAGDGTTTLSAGRRTDIAITLGDGGVSDGGDDFAVALDLAQAPDLWSGIVFVPASKDFGSLQESMQSAAATFTVQNQASITTATLTTSLAGSDAAQFHVDVDSCSGLQLAPAATCMVSVSFRPTGAGARAASLVVGAGAAALTGRALGGDGSSCSADGDCVHGNCVDGVCCAVAASACNGCNACNVAGKVGTCAPVLVGTDPHGSCAQACANKCDGAGACRPASAGTICQVGMTCANQTTAVIYGQYQHAGTANLVCDGSTLTCTQSQLMDCPNGNICNGTSCATSCSTDLNCRYGFFCDATGHCAGTLPTGSSCSRPRQCYQFLCASGSCQANCYGASNCNNSLSDCIYGAGGQNQCSSCYQNSMFNAALCQANGTGSTCNSSGMCQCASNADCRNSEAPNCINVNGWGQRCGCFQPNGPGNGADSCPFGMTCVNSSTTDWATACKMRSGFPCGAASQCASGVCLNGSCS